MPQVFSLNVHGRGEQREEEHGSSSEKVRCTCAADNVSRPANKRPIGLFLRRKALGNDVCYIESVSPRTSSDLREIFLFFFLFRWRHAGFPDAEKQRRRAGRDVLFPGRGPAVATAGLNGRRAV